MPRKMTTILGIPVDLMDMAQTVETIFATIEEYSCRQQPRYVATLNVDFLTNAHSWRSGTCPRNPALLQSLREAHVVTADGMPIVWMSRLLGQGIPERVTGADLVPHIAQEACTREKSIFFLGGQEAVATEAAQRLQQWYPSLRIAGIACPWIEDIATNPSTVTPQDEVIVETINAAHPDILFISFGNPKQELWFRRVRSILQVPVAIGIGGTLAFITGAIPRAPHLMRILGLEWLYRLKEEPCRLWKRYSLGCLKFLAMVTPLLAQHMISTIRARLVRGKKTQATVSSAVSNNDPIIELPSVLTGANSDSWTQNISEALDNYNAVILDFRCVIHLDATGIAGLLELAQKGHAQGKKISGTAMTPWTQNLLRAHRVSDLLRQFVKLIITE